MIMKFNFFVIMFFLVASPCRAEVSCDDMMARVRAGEKISSGQWWDCLAESEKEEVVVAVINIFKERDGVIIKSPASYYVKEIDAFRAEAPILKDSTIRYLLSVTAAMSYDFDEGIPKEETLKKFQLPEDANYVIEMRKKENTPEGMMPVGVLSRSNVEALFKKTIKEARGFTADE